MKIINDDCLHAMAAMQENSIDTIITDPPYGLEFMGKGWDTFSGNGFRRANNPADVSRDNIFGRTTGRAPQYFAGTPYQQYMTPIFAECRRVAKPGAMLLVFGGTRTYHRLACAIEDAGWEIRDCLMWLYGSGFPKSLDISKAIDKSAGAQREVIGHARSINCVERGYDKVYSTKADNSGYGTSKTFGLGTPITAPATELAKLWDGWGTALKPAWEPILLAMKPCDGTYVDNATKHGVAGLNINGGRVEGGRWPANVILDEEAGAQLDAQTGNRPGCKSPSKAKCQSKFRPEQGAYQGQGPIYADDGGASRFFYCAKASRKERGEGNTHPTVKPLELMRYLVRLTKTPTGGVVLDPFAGSGSTGLACEAEGRECILIEQDASYCDIIRRRAA